MDMNIRNIPKEVMLKVKVASAQSGMTLRQYVLSKLMDEPREVIRPDSLSRMLTIEEMKTAKFVSDRPARIPPPVDTTPKYYVPLKYRKGDKK